MPAAAKRNNSEPLPERPTRPISIGGFAEHLGITRQRLYGMVRNGQVRTQRVHGGLVVMPDEAARVIDAIMRVDTRKGKHRLIFDFV